MKTKNMTTLHLRKSSGRPPLRRALLFIPLVLACFGLSLTTQAVTPAPDGGYAGQNTAEGDQALFNRTTGVWNTAVGFQTLFSDTTGSTNTATGYAALSSNTGDANTAVGSRALINHTSGDGNIALGANAGTNIIAGSSNIDIGNAGSSGESNTIRIGSTATQMATFIAGISGVTVANGVPVVVNANGQLGIAATSSARFKDEIKPMDKASEAVLALKPVTFRYKQELDPKGIPQFGLVAEDVAKVNPDLVGRDAQGKVYTVRYEAVNAMLLNEFLKEHKTVQELKKEIAALTATVKEQAAQIQKVSAHLELSKPAPQTVVNNQ
jgi:Chaperone of endosialidase